LTVCEHQEAARSTNIANFAKPRLHVSEKPQRKPSLLSRKDGMWDGKYPETDKSIAAQNEKKKKKSRKREQSCTLFLFGSFPILCVETRHMQDVPGSELYDRLAKTETNHG
jgi:hypothetical protein